MGEIQIPRDDALNKPINKLKSDRDFWETLNPEQTKFMNRVVEDFEQKNLYFRRALIIDATANIEGIQKDLDAFSGLEIYPRIELALKNYFQLLLMVETERENFVKRIKELMELVNSTKETTTGSE